MEVLHPLGLLLVELLQVKVPSVVVHSIDLLAYDGKRVTQFEDVKIRVLGLQAFLRLYHIATCSILF